MKGTFCVQGRNEAPFIAVLKGVLVRQWLVKVPFMQD
jgi:hypothetical protein